MCWPLVFLRTTKHCVKSVQIRSFCWSSQTEYGKVQTKKTPHLDTFLAVKVMNGLCPRK